jgi:hypothetical protein
MRKVAFVRNSPKAEEEAGKETNEESFALWLISWLTFAGADKEKGGGRHRPLWMPPSV